MSLLDFIQGKRLVEVATAIPAIPATTEPQLGRTVARIAKVQVANVKAEKSDISIAVLKSRWWLVHFRDREPKEICRYPLAAADKMLSAIDGAISVEAISDGSSGLASLDRYGHWSESEVLLAKQRTDLFVLRGVPLDDADALACSLVERDRTGDDRRSCAECVSRSYGRCRRSLVPLGGGGVEVLHRCKRFSQIKDE
jgi:hypothetical protein